MSGYDRRLTRRLQTDANLRFAPVRAAEPQVVRRSDTE